VPIDAGHCIASGLTETDYTDCGQANRRYEQFGCSRPLPVSHTTYKNGFPLSARSALPRHQRKATTLWEG